MVAVRANHPQEYLGGVTVAPISKDHLTLEERLPIQPTEEAVLARAAEHGISPLRAEHAIRLLNKAYNNRLTMLKNALAEFHQATGIKAVQAKEEVWLPNDRKVSHAEFITSLNGFIKEYTA